MTYTRDSLWDVPTICLKTYSSLKKLNLGFSADNPYRIALSVIVQKVLNLCGVFVKPVYII